MTEEDETMTYQTTTDRIGPDVQTYRAESIEDALEQLREDLRNLAHEQPDFAGLADEADESWLEPAV